MHRSFLLIKMRSGFVSAAWICSRLRSGFVFIRKQSKKTNPKRDLGVNGKEKTNPKRNLGFGEEEKANPERNLGFGEGKKRTRNVFSSR